MMHPENIFLAERISRVIGLDVCVGYIIQFDTNFKRKTEVSRKSMQLLVFRMHLTPSEGLPRNVAAPVIDMLSRENHAEFLLLPLQEPMEKLLLLILYCKNNGFKVGFTTLMGFTFKSHDGKRRYYWTAKCRVHFERSNGRICCSGNCQRRNLDLVWVLVYVILGYY
jgi:cyanophycin synthetase